MNLLQPALSSSICGCCRLAGDKQPVRLEPTACKWLDLEVLFGIDRELQANQAGKCNSRILWVHAKLCWTSFLQHDEGLTQPHQGICERSQSPRSTAHTRRNRRSRSLKKRTRASRWLPWVDTSMISSRA